MANIGNFLQNLDKADRRDLVQAIESLIRILMRHDKSDPEARYFPF